MNPVLDIPADEEIHPEGCDLRYLHLLARQFPTVTSASTEIINLQAILNLPKGTEHFLSDLHGEYESFIHVLKNASGVIKLKIEDVFGPTLLDAEKKSLATLIYYPEEKIHLARNTEPDMTVWYERNLYLLIEMCRNASSKYTRSKVRKALPAAFAYIIEELLHEDQGRQDKREYYKGIIQTIIDIGSARDLLVALANLIQRLVIDRMHIIGDIFDRGPGADIIMDRLAEFHSVDVQWGNHDILWMGAAAGSWACMANVIRIQLRYGNQDTLEDGYGINLLPLATFALEHYSNEQNPGFDPKDIASKNMTPGEIELIRKMHKAITVIQFKLEGQVIRRRPHFDMGSRLLLESIDTREGTVCVEGQAYPLKDAHFPTLSPADPYRLTPEEHKVMEKMASSFQMSEKLHRHIRFLYAHGSMYRIHNQNLLFHGCVPMEEDGSFTRIVVEGETYQGKSLYDRLDRLAREAYFFIEDPERKQYGMDVMWYLWCGPRSPLFGKKRMTTFERYFLADKVTHEEPKDPFFKTFRDDEASCRRILADFGVDPRRGHIFCGHVPVKVKKGESPIKANGKLIVLDGGFSRAYQPQTGIAGYTLIFNSHGLQLVSHESFTSTQTAIEEEKDILSVKRVLEHTEERIRIRDTDAGQELSQQVGDLKALLHAFRKGLIKERY